MKVMHCFIPRYWIILCSVLLGLFLAGCDRPQTAPDKSSPYRIGILVGINSFLPSVEGFKDEFARLGFKEGEDVIFDIQMGGSNKARMREISKQFVAQDVDMIVAVTSGAVQIAVEEAKKTSIPLVFLNAMNPVSAGVINSFSQPEPGVTGVYSRLDEYIGKRLEILQKLSPDVKSVWIPHNPDYPTVAMTMPTLRRAAEILKLKLITDEIESAQDVVAKLDDLEAAPFDAIMIFPEQTVQRAASWEAIRSFAAKYRLPVVGNNRKQVQQGALFTYRYLNYESGRLGADLAKRVLESGDKAAIPMIKTQPRLIINTTAAAQIGLKLDPVVLDTAWELIR